MTKDICNNCQKIFQSEWWSRGLCEECNTDRYPLIMQNGIIVNSLGKNIGVQCVNCGVHYYVDTFRAEETSFLHEIVHSGNFFLCGEDGVTDKSYWHCVKCAAGHNPKKPYVVPVVITTDRALLGDPIFDAINKTHRDNEYAETISIVNKWVKLNNYAIRQKRLVNSLIESGEGIGSKSFSPPPPYPKKNKYQMPCQDMSGDDISQDVREKP